MHARPEQFTSIILKDLTNSTQAAWGNSYISGGKTRMSDERLPKKIYEELQTGNRSQDGQKKQYKDTLKDSLKNVNIS